MNPKMFKTPYYVVIFTYIMDRYDEEYVKMSKRLKELVMMQDGFLGIESFGDERGITVSYWENLQAIEKWKNHEEHKIARKKARQTWYKYFKVEVAKVERAYEFDKFGDDEF